MPEYANGYLPLDRLVKVGSGYTSDGYYEHLLPPATAKKHYALVALGEKERGRTLEITPGYNGYRPMAIQVQARERWGLGAADPGKSSHGGDWAGPPTNWVRVDTAAIDYGNWEYVWGTRQAFFDACRRVGLTPGGIAAPYFPDEPWHVIDLDPWAPVPADDAKEGDMPTSAEVADYLLNKKKFKDGLTVGQTLVKTRQSSARNEILNARILAALETGAGATGQFYKHGGDGVTLWIFVHPSGDFVRIRDVATARLYKELNGGVMSMTLSPEAIRLLIQDLTSAGGKDLSAVSGSITATTATTANQAEADAASSEEAVA